MKTKTFLALALTAAISVAASTANADAAKGAKLFKKKCGVCHSTDAGKHKVGPSLNGIIGRKAGSTDFKKYKALKGSKIVWTEKNLDGWITNPKKFIGKPTAMTAKIKKAADRDNIIDFLKGK